MISQDISLGVIFDMDGVVVDSMPFHDQAWTGLMKERGIKVRKRDLHRGFAGKTNPEILTVLLGRKLTKQKIGRFAAEKEARYQKLFRAHIKPLKGIRQFLRQLSELPRITSQFVTLSLSNGRQIVSIWQ